jgi:hypothetical protein
MCRFFENLEQRLRVVNPVALRLVGWFHDTTTFQPLDGTLCGGNRARVGALLCALPEFSAKDQLTACSFYFGRETWERG